MALEVKRALRWPKRSSLVRLCNRWICLVSQLMDGWCLFCFIVLLVWYRCVRVNDWGWVISGVDWVRCLMLCWSTQHAGDSINHIARPIPVVINPSASMSTCFDCVSSFIVGLELSFAIRFDDCCVAGRGDSSVCCGMNRESMTGWTRPLFRILAQSCLLFIYFLRKKRKFWSISYWFFTIVRHKRLRSTMWQVRGGSLHFFNLSFILGCACLGLLISHPPAACKLGWVWLFRLELS